MKDKDKKKKLGAEKLEKREAPFMPISYQDDTEGTGGGTTQERTGSRQVGEDNVPDEGGSLERPRYDRTR